MNLTDDMQKYEERTESTLKRLVRNYDDLKPPHPLMIEDSRGALRDWLVSGRGMLGVRDCTEC